MGKRDRPLSPVLRAIDGLRGLFIGVIFVVLGGDGIYIGDTSTRIVGAVGLVAGAFIILAALILTSGTAPSARPCSTGGSRAH